MDSPDWLAEDAPAPAAAAPAAEGPVTQAPPPPAPPASSSLPDDSSAGATNPQDLDRIKFLKRVLNMLASSACATRAILIIITIPSSVSEFVISVYAAILSVFVFLSEMTEVKFMKWILSSHGYLYSAFWRFWFYCLLASMQLSMKGLFGYINAGVMGALAFVNAYWLIRYPGLRSVNEKQQPAESSVETTNL